MAYAYQFDVPTDEAFYRRIRAEIGDEPAEGLVVQLVVKHDKGVRHIGVWNTRQDWERFRAERVQPALAKVFAASSIGQPPPRPNEHEMEIIDVDLGG
jgi:hypothetical protein